MTKCGFVGCTNRLVTASCGPISLDQPRESKIDWEAAKGKSKNDRETYLVLKRGAQPTGVEVPNAHLAVRRAGDDCACAGRPNGCTGAISGANDVDEDDSFHTLARGMASQRRDHLTLT